MLTVKMASLFTLVVLQDMIHRRSLRRRPIFRNREDAFALPDDVFIDYFRLTKHLVHDICNELSPSLQGTSSRNNALSLEIKVTIKDSTLNYIPHEMFEDVEVDYLEINNLTLSAIFDQQPKALKTLKYFHLENTKVLRGVIWEFLGPLTELAFLEVYNVSVKTLKKDFNKYASKNIQGITFYGTETKSIKPGVFDNFTRLEKLYIDEGNLTELRRDYFPTPFYSIGAIGINGHHISHVPADMFTGMPNLIVVGLMRNRISVLDAAAFGGSASHLTTLALNGNPLKCDCRIHWLLVHKPHWLHGYCASPNKLKGRDLNSLKIEDINCRQ